MIQTYDVGSLPFAGQWANFLQGAQVTPFLEALHPAKYGGDKEYFEARVTESFLDKIRAGVDVPNYPQFRDMNEMFLNAIDGIVKTGEGYVVRDSLSITRDKLLIPEVHVLRDRSRHIREVLDKPVRIKICVTGPYTLSTFFAPERKGLFTLLGDAVAQIVKHNIFSTKFGGVVLVTVDEPVFGFLDDPNLDYGAEGREELLAAWERIFDHVKAKGCQSCIHLHNTSNELFWQIRSVDILESHVGDPFYATPRTRRFLEKELPSNEGGGKDTHTCPGIKKPDVLATQVEHRGHEIGDMRGSEKLAQFLLLSSVRRGKKLGTGSVRDGQKRVVVL